MKQEIIYKDAKDINARAVLELFRVNKWREWYSIKDTRDLFEYALYVATAWDQDRSIGICTLFGDGRFYARIDTLLVDEDYRRLGIGRHLVEMVVSEVNKLKPHYCELDTHEEWLVQMYKQFGFELHNGPWLIHGPTEKRLISYVEMRRSRLQRNK